MDGEQLLTLLLSRDSAGKALALDTLRNRHSDPEFRSTMEYLCVHFDKQRKRKIKAYIEKPDLFSNPEFYLARGIIEQWCKGAKKK